MNSRRLTNDRAQVYSGNTMLPLVEATADRLDGIRHEAQVQTQEGQPSGRVTQTAVAQVERCLTERAPELFEALGGDERSRAVRLTAALLNPRNAESPVSAIVGRLLDRGDF